MNANQLSDYLFDITDMETSPYYQAATMLRQQQTEIEALKKEAALQRLSDFTQEADNEPVAWKVTETDDEGSFTTFTEVEPVWTDSAIPLYTHPAKTQLSNGHLSDCAIHNEPASRNKDCDCGFEPKFDLSGLKHEDNCRYFDDELYCSCGADNYALVEWYRHKKVAHPAKTLTEEEIIEMVDDAGIKCGDSQAVYFARAILRKAQEK